MLPRVIRIRQHFQGQVVPDPEQEVAKEFARIQLAGAIKPGMRIAITAGSRGIANIPVILRGIASWLKERGALPFLVPAMGSHGGATAEGQIEVLHGLGISEAFCGLPIRSSMGTVQLGVTASGIPVFTDQLASEADGIIVVGRIKVHTDFQSPIGIESGLMKMAAIGLGKHKQALLLHSYGVVGIRDRMPEVAEVVLSRGNILCGVGIIENAYEQTAAIEAIPTPLIPERERELLKQSASLMPKLPVEQLDILMVDKIGKNYSGTGMDTNIIGRVRIRGVEEFTSPSISYVIAGDLSEECGGNALGIGLADLTTKRLFNKIDFKKTNENVITSTFLTRAAIPIVLEHDRAAVETALRCNWGVDSRNARFMRIANTLHLEELYVSEALLPELQGRTDLEQIGKLEEMTFDEHGYFPGW